MKTKRILSFILATILLFSLATVSFAAASKGDVDGDKKITVEDARKCLRAAIGLGKLSEAQKEAADVDYDGEVTIKDARIILRAAIGLSDGNPGFENVLYDHSHALLGSAKSYVTNDITGIAKNFQKWCAEYTVNQVLRPVLAKLDYKQSAIDKLAPSNYPSDLWYKLFIHNGVPALSAKTAAFTVSSVGGIYTPSMLMGYYQLHENDNICKIYNFVEYYDNEIERTVVPADKSEIKNYKPKVGDLLFITNKTMFEKAPDGEYYTTIIHTAQIIKVYDDGTFLTTEGAIIEPSEGDNVARVRERVYFWNDDIQTNLDAYGKVIDGIPEKHYSSYQFRYNSTVIVLAAVRPNWAITE